MEWPYKGSHVALRVELRELRLDARIVGLTLRFIGPIFSV
jgi:hypothetical protein